MMRHVQKSRGITLSRLTPVNVLEGIKHQRTFKDPNTRRCLQLFVVLNEYDTTRIRCHNGGVPSPPVGYLSPILKPTNYEIFPAVKTYSNPVRGLEGSRRLRLPDFKTIGT